MKGGKEEEKMMGPLFPRLHVNDADKGGPRAPPRNKMALYEQLSIPSQRFSPAQAPSRPLPPQNGGSQLPSTSLSQGYGHDRNNFSSFYMPPHTPAHSAEKVHSRSSGGMNNNASRLQSESRSTKHANDRFLAATGSAAECSSLRLRQSSYGKKSSGNVCDDDDDFRVPTFVQPGNATCSNKDTPVLEAENGTPICSKAQQKGCSTFNSSSQVSKSSAKVMEQSKPSSVSEKETNEDLVIKEPNERSVHHMVSRENLPGSSHSPKASSDHSRTINRHRERGVQGQETCGAGAGASGVFKCLNEDTVRAKNESCSRASVDANSQSLEVAEKQNPEINGKPNGSPEMGDAEGNDEASDSSMVDSMSGMEISPDDVVGIIGPKHFWKARRAIINQQRVFAIQVFELHRLIKVQKLIAASPNILLERNPYLNKSSQKVVPTKNLQHEPVSMFQPTTTRPKDDLQKPNQSVECPTERTVDAQPLPNPEDASQGGNNIQNPRTSPYVGNSMPIPMALDHQKPNAWCYPSPANQWLVPVMSPSEGLCYKPYSGPCPPGGFMAPVYGGCCPMSLPPVAGDFMNSAYGIPASHQQQNMGVLSGNHPVAPNYFPAPYPVPVMNQVMSPSAVEQVSPLASTRPLGQTEQSSCNIPNLRRETISGRRWKVQGQVSKETGLQGSTASSPCEKTQGDGRDALPLFPTAPPSETSAQPSVSCGRENQTRVIKVVPHNARSATESAARIFRSIQEERQQQDS
ncbi:hypothetical protein J5N97_019284 [Dioscorea zingiberensis]|uniref:Early flowering 3 n=1 Tax=Dioscorea zingiberensis TaxID=325984 RepID=A0A9D5HCJ1_9LILI|nr:hypothetical protein J5N97_019284 [Dioscorea zingiberensis]